MLHRLRQRIRLNRSSPSVQPQPCIGRATEFDTGAPMRLTILAALLCSSLALPAWAGDNEPKGQMVVLKANQIGQIFCLSRTGNDEAVIAGILTADLQKAIKVAEQKDDDWAKKNPGEKPPLGDGIGWQSSPDYADKCEIGLVTLSKTDAKVEIKYS